MITLTIGCGLVVEWLLIDSVYSIRFSPAYDFHLGNETYRNYKVCAID